MALHAPYIKSTYRSGKDPEKNPLRSPCAGRAGARSVVFNHSASPFGFSIGRASEGSEQAPLFSTYGHRLVFKARGCLWRSDPVHCRLPRTEPHHQYSFAVNALVL